MCLQALERYYIINVVFYIYFDSGKKIPLDYFPSVSQLS